MRTSPRRSFAVLAATAATTALGACTPGDAAPGTVDAGGAAQDAAGQDAGGEAPAQEAAPVVVPDGTHEATGVYASPAGDQKLTVSITLADGVVTAVDVTPQATDPTSLEHQTAVASVIAQQVVGRPLAEVDVETVAGSSLATLGFLTALEQIADRAAS